MTVRELIEKLATIDAPDAWDAEVFIYLHKATNREYLAIRDVLLNNTGFVTIETKP